MKNVWLAIGKRIQALGWEHRMLLSAGLLALIPVLGSVIGTSAPTSGAVAKRETMVDTFIPKGFVLVPIDIENYQALDSILGRFGVVDLFQSGVLVARNVRILRAPQNPSNFAILVRESEVGRILRKSEAFTAIVKRPEALGTEIVKPESRRQRTIIYEGET